MGKILVVDDEPNVLAAFEEILGEQGHQVCTARRGDAGLQQLEAGDFDLAILDIRMPGMSGLEALERIQSRWPGLPVIVMTGHGTMETAIEATKRGAFDYQVKPFEPSEMLRIVERALEGARLMRNGVTLGPEPAGPAGDAIIGRSPAMQEVYKAIGRVAPTEATVLIRGESGTGKELVARAIYQHSLRRGKPLLVVNCVAIPETLLESELFGYERGAFTGAASRRIGKLEQANGATLLLDEIGDIPLSIQAKILRVLQEKTFERLGSNETIRSDVRLLAATNRDLEKAIAEGGFREDLYHRLNVVTIRIPPLRERSEDIPELVAHFLARFAAELGMERPVLSDEALQAMKRHPWPGNVRELEHGMHRAVIFTRGFPIQTGDLASILAADGTRGSAASSPPVEQCLVQLVRHHLSSYAGENPHEALLAEVEKEMICEALRRTGGNQTHASRLLGIPRPTLHAKMQKYGLHEAPRTPPGPAAG